ncbi:hypothetical protein GCM10027565_01800 [Bordetella tumulicola]
MLSKGSPRAARAEAPGWAEPRRLRRYRFQARGRDVLIATPPQKQKSHASKDAWLFNNAINPYLTNEAETDEAN